ncbi:MAG: hypothetical protein DMF06_08015 [Verrucomicrobia bacterium]|nr:MAG: hypothetical protein DMF06_08015 [Verrucomicrobiota bacterium]
MKTVPAKLLLTFIATACLVLGLSSSLQAKKVEFPADDPAFTFNLPDGWTTENGPDGRIYCTAKDGFKIAFVASPGVKSDADAKEMLPKVITAMSDAMKCQNFKSDEMKSGKVGDLTLTGVEAACKVEGTDMSLNAVAFAIGGKYFSIVGASTKEVDKAHGKDMNDIIGSIAAAE